MIIIQKKGNPQRIHEEEEEGRRGGGGEGGGGNIHLMNRLATLKKGALIYDDVEENDSINWKTKKRPRSLVFRHPTNPTDDYGWPGRQTTPATPATYIECIVESTQRCDPLRQIAVVIAISLS